MDRKRRWKKIERSDVVKARFETGDFFRELVDKALEGERREFADARIFGHDVLNRRSSSGRTARLPVRYAPLSLGKP